MDTPAPPPSPSTQQKKSEMSDLMSHRYIAQCARGETEAYRTTFDAIRGGAVVYATGEFGMQVGGLKNCDYNMTGVVMVSPLLLATYDEIVTVIHAACKAIQSTAVGSWLCAPAATLPRQGRLQSIRPLCA